jgi:hypothetical protein
MTSSLSTRIDAQRAKIARLNEELRELLLQQGNEFLTEGLAEFWEKYPDCQTILWEQYVPLWNDGEECVFSMNEVYFSKTVAEDLESVNDAEEDDSIIDEWHWVEEDGKTRSVKNPEFTAEKKRDFQAVRDMITELDVETLFGSNALVKVSRDGVTVEEIDPPY